MKTARVAPDAEAAPIVRLADVPAPSASVDVNAVRLLIVSLLLLMITTCGQRGPLRLPDEPALAHADGVAGILEGIGAAPTLRAAAYLVYAADFLQRPEEMVRNAFGESYAGLVEHTRKLVQVQRAARQASLEAERRELQTERVRKMLLAFSRDLRVVLLRLASRLQTLRGTPRPSNPAHRNWRCGVAAGVRAAGQPPGHLANQAGTRRPGVSIPAARRVRAHRPPARRNARAPQQAVRQASERVRAELAAAGIDAQVQGRPKHPFSIHKKMQGKGSTLPPSTTCVHCAWWWPMCPTVMRRCRACMRAGGRCRISSMTTSRGPRPTDTDRCTRWWWTTTAIRWSADPHARDARARRVRCRCALGVQGRLERVATRVSAPPGLRGARGTGTQGGAASVAGLGARSCGAGVARRRAGFDDRIFVFTPQATVIELPAGSTPVDFATPCIPTSDTAAVAPASTA
jgi:GTP pyrophosphokinase